jgi:maleate cis-trans isomerase
MTARAQITDDLVGVVCDPALAEPGHHRRRVALIVPSINSCVEPEMQGLAPTGVSVHATRLALPTGSPDELVAMAASAGAAARLLAHLSPDVVLFHCTAATTAIDVTLRDAIHGDIAREVDCPVLTTGEVVLDALAHLDAKTVALITPYTDAVTRTEAAFLERHGIQVTNWAALELAPAQFPQVSPRAWVEIVRRVDLAGADAVFLSCANIRALEAIPDLERELGRPVVASNQIALWGVLRALGIDTPLKGAGALLDAGGG